jgi:pimeloyl-ACP methyl ester carboxylesterase
MNQFFDLKTHKLAYRLQEIPGRPRVLFLHGCGANHTQFDREFTMIGKDYSVAAISLRGQGKSTRPPGNRQADMTMSALAYDVIQWLNDYNWKQPHVIACSMGGVVALEMLHQQKELFKSLITFGTTPKLASSRILKAGIWVADIMLPALFPNWIANVMSKATTAVPEAQQRLRDDLKEAYKQRTTIYQLRCELANYDYTHILRESTIPVLLLQGEKDSAINREIEKLWPLIKENPLLSREWLKDAGHIANYDQPQAFYESVIRFIGDHTS